MTHLLRTWLLALLAWGALSAHAGSYEDFFAAIKRDDAGDVAALLRRGFDPNTRDPAGQHGLYLAIREPSPRVAQLLIDAPKTEVESLNKADESPLMMAALKGHVELAQELVKRGADVNKPGWAPLHYAATGGHLAIMELLLEHHAFIDAESPNGTTPLMMAAQYGSLPAVKLLLEAGADTDMKNQLGLTAIDFANRGGRPEVAELVAAEVRKRRATGRW